MSLKKRVYSVLVVSSSGSFNSALKSLLPETFYDPVLMVSDISAAKRILAERVFDFIIINSPKLEDDVIAFSIQCCTSKEASVLLMVKKEANEKVRQKVVPYGVFTLPKPTSKSVLSQALLWMESSRERLRRFEKKTHSIENKMEEIRIVNRAKWLLISKQNMTEPDAHRFIEKQAMDLCISKKSIAEKIINEYHSEET